ncbi:hypothetical protein [Streptomyces sp. MZ04]|uniref:hypothetical protein n=1 Tax=Streptomyces sp. MZ04 TaxID=2559236 RepID=UPI00107EA6CE|nr:hypothetical protein [Streptomyces sp. MZ04]TGB12624.1 hypothetical protein E2651_11615 [Streptomyces sp. MZ04]
MKVISGHAPGHVRAAFTDAVAEAGISAGQTLKRDGWGHLWNVSDILPGSCCDDLDLPHGSSYAQAVRSLPKT